MDAQGRKLPKNRPAESKARARGKGDGSSKGGVIPIISGAEEEDEPVEEVEDGDPRQRELLTKRLLRQTKERIFGAGLPRVPGEASRVGGGGPAQAVQRPPRALRLGLP